MNDAATGSMGEHAVLTDQTGAVVERDAYDAWGKRRNLDGSDDTACALTSQTTRGFTGHEHIDDLCLIDANARLYDPTLGRFLSPDDMIPEPTDMQSLNRFSYVRNRPLSVTDPTGHDDGCPLPDCVVVNGSRDPMFWNDFEGSIDYSVGGTLPGLTSWGSSAAGTPDATAGAAAPSGPTGGSKSQNDQRNREHYWKVTHVHQNSDGTWTIAYAYVQGYIDSDGYLDVSDVIGTPEVAVVNGDTHAGRVSGGPGYFTYGPSTTGQAGRFSWSYSTYATRMGAHGENLTIQFWGNADGVQAIQYFKAWGDTHDDGKWHLDVGKWSVSPYYDFHNSLNLAPGEFQDTPNTYQAQISFRAETLFVRTDVGGGYTPLGFFKWGFDYANGTTTLLPVEQFPLPKSLP